MKKKEIKEKSFIDNPKNYFHFYANFYIHPSILFPISKVYTTRQGVKEGFLL